MIKAINSCGWCFFVSLLRRQASLLCMKTSLFLQVYFFVLLFYSIRRCRLDLQSHGGLQIHLCRVYLPLDEAFFSVWMGSFWELFLGAVFGSCFWELFLGAVYDGWFWELFFGYDVTLKNCVLLICRTIWTFAEYRRNYLLNMLPYKSTNVIELNG